MKKKKYVFSLLLILLCSTIVGIVLEYVRIKKTYLHYLSSETRLETNLIARLAKNALEQGDLKGFARFCNESGRYSLSNRALLAEDRPLRDGDAGKSATGGSVEKDIPAWMNEKTLDDDAIGVTSDPLSDPLGLESRITLFDASGNVLFDSWLEADMMENHADRPEFQLMMRVPDTAFPAYSFERYSTTLQKKMFVCITKFEVDGSVYLLRSGNTLQSVKMAESEYRQNLLVFSLFFLLAILLLILLFYSKVRDYRARFFEIGDGLKRGNLESDLPDPSQKPLSVDRVIHSIQGEIDLRNGLLARERQLRNVIFESLVEGVVLLDHNGGILDMNENARRLLELQPKIGRGVSIFGVWRNFELEELFRQGQWAESDAGSVQKELRVELPGGERCLDVRMRQVSWGKSSSGCLLLLYDLTRVRRLERYRKDFVSNVSHEIKTPLTVIMGTVEALREGALDDQNVARNFLETLDTHAKRLYALVQDVLSLSNLESESDLAVEHFETISLLVPIEMAISLCELQANENRISIVLENQTVSEPVFPMNSSLIEQAFVNLIDNAVKYTADENILKNKPNKPEEPNEPGRPLALKKVLLRVSNPEEEEVLVEVIDEGPGIPLKHQERIFERFYRVDESRSHQTGGTGLGLAIVKHIVQLHHGSIAVKNNLVHGCVFSLRFSMSNKKKPAERSGNNDLETPEILS